MQILRYLCANSKSRDDTGDADNHRVSLVAYPDANDKKTWKCIKEGCGQTCTAPKAMAMHLTEKHHEYDGFTLCLATVTYQTKKGVTNSRHTDYSIYKPAKRPRSAEGPERSAKAAKSDAQLSALALLESANKLAAKQNEDLSSLNERLMKTVEDMTRTQAVQAETQAVQAATWSKQVATHAEMVGLLSKGVLQGSNRPAASLESAMETFRTCAAFQQMRAGANDT